MLKTTETLLTLSLTTLISIIIGFAIGLLAAALYFIPLYQNKLTFADLGGMLAGIGTIILAAIALKTASTWKNQSLHQLQLNYVNELSATITKYFQEISSLLEHVNNKYLDSPFEGLCLSFTELTEMVSNVTNSTSNIEETLIRYEAIMNTKTPEGLNIDNSIIKTIDNLLKILSWRSKRIRSYKTVIIRF
jgi:hypothetical protein